MSDEKPKKRTYKTTGKKRSRGHGQGAFYQNPKTKMWVGRISLGKGPDGKRIRSAPVYSMDKGVVQEELERLRENARAGIAQVPKKRISVDSRIREWAEKRKRGWSPSHYRDVLSVINQQIKPSIGEADFKTLDTDTIHWWLTWMDEQTKEAKVKQPDGKMVVTEKPRWSTRTRQVAYDRVRQWLDDELKERPRLIRENVAALVPRPEAISRERGTHTAEQARQVLTAALGWGDPYVTLWVARYTSALRQGELLGMQEDRIDWDALTWDISWQMQQLPLKPGFKNSDDPDRFIVPETYEHIPIYKNLALVKPKTRRPRIQPIAVELAITLKIYLEARVPNQWGLLWVTEQFRPIRPENEREMWYDAQSRAEVPIIEGHGTRHTANTLIPVDETHRMKFLGQSTAAANRLYLHEDLEKLRAGQNALAGMLLPEKLVPGERRA